MIPPNPFAGSPVGLGLLPQPALGQPPIPTAPHPVLPPMPAGIIPGVSIPGGPNNPMFKMAQDIHGLFGPPGGKSPWNKIAYALLMQNANKYKGPAYNPIPAGVTLPPNPYTAGG